MRPLLLAVTLVAIEAHAGDPKVLTLARPRGGDWLSLSVSGQKIGWVFANVSDGTFEGSPAVVSVSDTFLRMKSGDQVLENRHRVEKFYERRDGGRLLGFRVERTEHGTTMIDTGRCSQGTCKVLHSGGGAAQPRTLEGVTETIDSADPTRLALARGGKLKVAELDDRLALSTQIYEPIGADVVELTAGPVKVTRVRDSNGSSMAIAADGRLVELRSGQLLGLAEPEAAAKALGQRTLDVSKVARIEIARPITAGATRLVILARGIPASLERTIAGRQKMERQADGSLRITVVVRDPAMVEPINPEWRARPELAPLLAPYGDIDSAHPRITALAASATRGKPDAWAAARALFSELRQRVTAKPNLPGGTASDVLARGEAAGPSMSIAFTALCRAAGIPARSVSGLAYAGDAFYFQEWTEVYVGEWVSVDPFTGQLVADASHIALGGELGRALGQVELQLVEP